MTRFEHTLFNQVRQVVDAQQAATTLTYDPNGNLRTLTDARNHVTEYTYDVTALSRRDARAPRVAARPASGRGAPRA